MMQGISKICSMCSTIKQLSQFSKGIGKLGTRAACKVCLNSVAVLYRGTHSAEIALARSSWYHANKESVSIKNKIWAKNNPEKVKAARVKFLQANPRIATGYTRKYLYNIDLNEQKKILEPPCAICGGVATCIDHDHASGKIRGGLCRKCNSGLGMFADNSVVVRAAAMYLEKHRHEII